MRFVGNATAVPIKRTMISAQEPTNIEQDMPRRKKGRPIHGWLILDKPQDLTSTAAVGKIKRLFQAQKAGHAGTLDPLATGILPIAFGEATKTVAFAMDGEKSYRFTVRWGAQTSTDDVEGETIATSDERPSRAEIEAALDDFRGSIWQVPPRFSAIKIDGNRAYDLAREGEEVALEAREVMVHELDLVDTLGDEAAVFSAACGKGTYVRAIARDLGLRLECLGHITELRRTSVGPFAQDIAWSVEQLEVLCAEPTGDGTVSEDSDRHLAALLPVEAALDGMQQLKLSSNDASRIARGQTVILRGRDAPIVTGPAYATCNGRLVALVEAERGELRPTRVFNLTG